MKGVRRARLRANAKVALWQKGLDRRDGFESVRTVIVPKALPNKAVHPATGAAAGHCQRHWPEVASVSTLL
jgi:hypothetical protein